MLRLEHICKIYPTGEVLKDINWEVKPGDRIGLVGANGAGKSTQMKIIAGQIEPTSGEIIRPNSLNIAYLNQEFDVDPTKTVKEELWQAFVELQTEQPNEWELWCLGIGDIKPIEHPKIKHFGFVQPKDLATYTSQTGVFVLPSRFEPWGVVVHEFAASGFPLLLSNQVGAKEQFLQETKNGFEFKSENVSGLKASISSSLSTTILVTTDCTLPADSFGPTVFIKNGDAVNPTILSRI